MVEGKLGGGVIKTGFGPRGGVPIACLRRKPRPNGEGVSRKITIGKYY